MTVENKNGIDGLQCFLLSLCSAIVIVVIAVIVYYSTKEKPFEIEGIIGFGCQNRTELTYEHYTWPVPEQQRSIMRFDNQKENGWDVKIYYAVMNADDQLMGFQYVLENGVKMPEMFSLKLQQQEIVLYPMANNDNEEVCWFGMIVADNPCEADYLFCGMRILNCNKEVINQRIWEQNKCGSGQWIDKEIPRGMKIIGEDLYEENRDIVGFVPEPQGIGVTYWTPPN